MTLQSGRRSATRRTTCIYREVAGSNNWSLVGTCATPRLRDAARQQLRQPGLDDRCQRRRRGRADLHRHRCGRHAQSRRAGRRRCTENAVELPWEQNPYFIPALQAVGITTVGADASKAYPDPPDTTSSASAPPTPAPTYAAGQTFVDGTAQVAPRHPINIFYNASTEAQEVDEYNTLYDANAPGSQCHATSVTTCSTTPFTFADVINQVITGMLQNMLSNDPAPSYVHQTNIMGAPPAGAGDHRHPAGDRPTRPATGSCTRCSTRCWPSTTPTSTRPPRTSSPPWARSARCLATRPPGPARSVAGTVTATDTGGTVTLTNTGTAAINVPITVPTGTTVSGVRLRRGLRRRALGLDDHPRRWLGDARHPGRRDDGHGTGVHERQLGDVDRGQGPSASPSRRPALPPPR